jgi:glycosyltransferase involved in cell wall biosynthesis
MRVLFVKEFLAWPRSSGHDVHCYYMMRSLARLGHDVSLLTALEPSRDALNGLPLASKSTFPGINGRDDGRRLRLTPLQERYRSYWGVDPARIKAVGRLADKLDADAVVVAGLHVLPYLASVKNRCRIWYAADEWAWHHLSLVKLTDRSTWQELYHAAFRGLYERCYGPMLDRVWVVSEADRRAMRWVAGVHAVDLLPNGVDSDLYSPQNVTEVSHSCVFWGRLDFEPNIQALEWFCKSVWPEVRRQVADAAFTVYGFNPTPKVQALLKLDGVSLIPDLPDIRAEVGKHQVVVLPFVSGGGIKNKLLEAAAMGKPILCTPRACGGLRLPRARPLVAASTPAQWVRELTGLWSEPERRHALGVEARRWVEAHHTWDAAGRNAQAGIEKSLTAAGG